jgi:hypothetical protein
LRLAIDVRREYQGVDRHLACAECHPELKLLPAVLA